MKTEKTEWNKRNGGTHGTGTREIMLDVIMALIPAAVASILLFGPRALMILAVCVAACVLSEFIFQRAAGRTVTTGDLSAAVTGILLAFNLPVTIHPLIALLGGLAAVAVFKQMFGGLGRNWVNPALAACLLLTAAFPVQMTAWVHPFDYLHASSAPVVSTLSLLKQGSSAARMPGLMNLLVGDRAGCLGETCAAALLLGGIYLIVRKVISPVIPLCFLGTAALFSLFLGRNVLIDLLSGSLLLGAIFMATDRTTAPASWKGQAVYAVGCGAVTILIRAYGSLPDGVAASIVLMNLLSRLTGYAAARIQKRKETPA